MRFLILGGGPAGLTFANRILDAGIEDFLVLEKENEAGGLCRSVVVDGTALDVGGGHFLDIRRKEVTQFLFGFMPEKEWNLFDRDSQIFLHGQYIHHPFEANIWEFDMDSQIQYLKSIAAAGCNTGATEPVDFIDWIKWKLGEKIAEDYMLPYNRKLFGNDLERLGTYWLEKLPDVSFEETLKSCLERKAYGKQPGHAQFYYPKKSGYGELWIRMAQTLGGRIRYNSYVEKLDIKERTVRICDGTEYRADCIITTIPWNSIHKISGISDQLYKNIKKLKHTSIRIQYYPENLKTDAHWIYYPDEKLDYHRILVRHNFCSGSHGYWTETNENRRNKYDAGSRYEYLNEYAYPLNMRDKPDIMQALLDTCSKSNVYGIGRWGEHEHYNSDVTAERAMKLADKLIERSLEDKG